MDKNNLLGNYSINKIREAVEDLVEVFDENDKFVFYYKRMKNDMTKYQIVLCTKDIKGYRTIEHGYFNDLNKEEAQEREQLLNSMFCIYDRKDVIEIVATTMRKAEWKNGRL